jgi:hypothetical protein
LENISGEAMRAIRILTLFVALQSGPVITEIAVRAFAKPAPCKEKVTASA